MQLISAKPYWDIKSIEIEMERWGRDKEVMPIDALFRTSYAHLEDCVYCRFASSRMAGNPVAHTTGCQDVKSRTIVVSAGDLVPLVIQYNNCERVPGTDI